MIPFKIKAGGEELPFIIPSNWSETTFWQIAQLKAKGDITSLDELSIFSGIERRIINDLEFSAAQGLSIALQTALLKEEAPDFASLEPVFRFRLANKFIELPKEIERVPAGAVEIIRQILLQYYKPNEKEMDVPMEDLAMCLSLLCVAPYFGEFGDDGSRKAEKILEQVKLVPAVIAYPIINFFLKIWEIKPQSGTNVWVNLLLKLKGPLVWKP